MGPDKLPRFVVLTVFKDHCMGRFDPSPWVSENWISGLYLGDGRFVWGRFRDVDAAAHTCSFLPDSPSELPGLHQNESYPFMDGYWGQRAELVLDESRCWQRRLFEPSDKVRYPASSGTWMATRLSAEVPNGGQLVPGGWDHEHCAICNRKIGCGGESEGYVSPPDTWVCKECHGCFVVPRSLAFVN